MVFSAASESDDSLEALCRQYWHPVYAIARRSGADVETARDLTQGFFARLLEKGWLSSADRKKGRFRTFLAVSFKRFMVNEWHHDHAKKRGGLAEMIPLDAALAERISAGESAHHLSPDQIFDRRWAMALLDAAMRRLEEETQADGGNFDAIKHCLTADRGDIDYRDLALRLESSEGAARVAVHRMRKRYRLLIRDEVTRTLLDEADTEDEMRALMSALM